MRKDLSEKNYYELLNVSPDSSSEEIRKAYNRLHTLYTRGSLAVSSLLTTKDRDALLDKLKKALETLTDPEKRSNYDKWLKSGAETMYDREIDPDTFRVAGGPDNIGFAGRAVLIRDKTVVRGRRTIDCEQYRILFTKLQNLGDNVRRKVLLVTSSLKGEGKTMVTVNLGVVMAEEFKKRCLIIEGDLRNPTMSSYFRWPEGLPGFSEVLKGTVGLEEALLKVDGTDLYLLPASETSEPFRMIGSPSLGRIISEVRKHFDYILIDAPPVLPLADVSVLASHVDGILMVVRAGKTSKDIVAKSVKSVDRSKIVGFVLNGADVSFRDYRYY